MHTPVPACATESKAALLADENNRGYTPFAEETLDPQHQSRGDTKEGWYFGRCVWVGVCVTVPLKARCSTTLAP